MSNYYVILMLNSLIEQTKEFTTHFLETLELTLSFFIGWLEKDGRILGLVIQTTSLRIP